MLRNMSLSSRFIPPGWRDEWTMSRINLINFETCPPVCSSNSIDPSSRIFSPSLIIVARLDVILNEGYQKWISTKPEDKEERESLYHGQIAALKVKQVLVNTMENGKLLEEERKGDKNG